MVQKHYKNFLTSSAENENELKNNEKWKWITEQTQEGPKRISFAP